MPLQSTNGTVNSCVEHGEWTAVPKSPPTRLDQFTLKLKHVDAGSVDRIKKDGAMTFHVVGCSGDFSNHQPQAWAASAMAAQVRDPSPISGQDHPAMAASFLYHLGDVVYKPDDNDLNASRTEAPMTTMIGGPVCSQRLASQMLLAEPRALTRGEIDGLWRIFAAIGRTWKNTYHDSAGLKSSWLEFVAEKTLIRPSYVAEYVNALEVVEELITLYGEADAFEKLFLDNGIPPNSLDTRLAHAKHFVVDEFIRVQVVAGGFKNFIRPHQTEIRPENIVNYNGFIAGSRFNRIKPVRAYEDPLK